MHLVLLLVRSFATLFLLERLELEEFGLDLEFLELGLHLRSSDLSLGASAAHTRLQHIDAGAVKSFKKRYGRKDKSSEQKRYTIPTGNVSALLKSLFDLGVHLDVEVGLLLELGVSRVALVVNPLGERLPEDAVHHVGDPPTTRQLFSLMLDREVLVETALLLSPGPDVLELQVFVLWDDDSLHSVLPNDWKERSG